MGNPNRGFCFSHPFGITILIFLFVFTTLQITFATPSIEQKKQQAAQVQAEVDQIDTQLDQAVEQYNVARVELDKTEKHIERNKEDLAQATKKLKVYQKTLDDRIISIYKQGTPSIILVILNASDFNSFLVKAEWLLKVARRDVELVKKILKIKEEIEVTQTRLQEQREEKLVTKNKLEEQKQEIERKIAQKKTFLNSIQGEISALIREQQEREKRQQAQAVQRARATTASGTDSSPPPSRGGGSVVSIALSYLGVPYRYGGSSPSTGFDCSGFTMYVYRQVGKSLPHSSRMQYNCGTRIDRGSLRPGDLVFFGLDGIHHVGIYIGGGSYVHAPRTGDVVKVSSLGARRDYAGACRP